MEDFSPRQSPRVKDYLLTQTTNASPARLNTHGSTYSGYGSNIPTDHPSYIELKRDYSKALNTIEILRLEKSNLETALKYAKRSRPGDSLAGSYTSTGRRSPDRREYRSDHYAEVERRIYDLKQELEEHKKLLADNYLYTENLKREAHSHHSRMQEIDDLQSRNYLMRDEMDILSRELQTMTNRVADLEDERHQLLDKISENGQQRFPPRGIYKYVDYIYNAVDALPTNHHAYYHFQECFPDNENMEVLIEEKDSNTLILQTMKYLTNLLVNLSSNPTTLPSTLPVSSDSKGNSLNLMDKVTPRINGEATPLNQSALNASRSQRINAEQVPTRKSSSNNISRSMRQQQVEEEEAPVPRSPSRLNLTNMSNHTRKRSLGTGTAGTGTAKANHNTQPSFGDGVRLNAGTTSPNPNLSQRSLQKAGTPTNRSNISMNKTQTNRPKTNLDVSQRNNSQIGALNRSGYSSASPKTDRRPSNQRSALNVQPAAADVSHMSQNRSQNRSRNRVDATPQMLSEQITGVQYERELLERENRLRDLDRELAEKERLLQNRENQNERYPTEAGTAGFGTQASTNEEDKLYAYHSNSRFIDHHKSVTSSKPAQTNPRSKNDLNNRSHISNNPSRNQSIRQDTREALDRSNLRDNLNQSHHSAIPNRVIPSITTITDFDGSPKNNQTPHSRQDPTRKAISPFVFSSENIDAVNENDRASRSPAVGKCRIQSRPSIPDETTPIPANNRVSFQVYSQAGNSPYSRVSGWPQTQDKLDQSGANRSNIRIRDEYHTSHLIDQPAQRPSEYADHQDDDMRRKITFEQQQFDDDEQEEDMDDPQQDDEEIVSPNHMSLRARNAALRQKGTEYASFRVSFGRTESKDMRNGSPPPDQKGSLFVFDIPKRKRVSHNEQTYDIVKGKTVNYKLKSEGKDYQVNLAKSRTGTRTSTCSDFQSVLSDKPNSPAPSVPIENFKEAL